MEQEPSLDLTVNPKNVLWHTRGRHWDYEFVSLPEDPKFSSWWLVFQQVFSGTESNTEPIFRYGTLSLSPPRSFLAAAYQDPTLQDAFGRPISHRVMWFPDTALSFAAVKKSLPEDWAVQIIDFLRPRFETEAVFGLTKEQLRQLNNLSNGLGAYFCAHIQQRATSWKLRVARPSSPERWKVVEVQMPPGVVIPAMQTRPRRESVKDKVSQKARPDKLPSPGRGSERQSQGMSSEPSRVEMKSPPKPRFPVRLRTVSALLLVVGLPLGYLAYYYFFSPRPPTERIVRQEHLAIDVTYDANNKALNIFNKGKGNIWLWGNKLGADPKTMEKEGRLITPGGFHDILAVSMEREIVEKLGTSGELRVPFDVYLKDEDHRPYTAKVILLIKVAEDKLTIHTQTVAVDPMQW